jgi:2-dehydro-3-deoxy-D-arabinonate dehydratase
MKICRFKNKQAQARVGLVAEDASVVTNEVTLLDLTAAGVESLHVLLEREDLPGELAKLGGQKLPRISLREVQLLAPVERQEVWAAGVTYLRSKTARMEESDFSATAYDRVYAAERPELFFKSLAEKVVPTGEAVGIRKDAKWSVPEPELALVLNSRGKIAGYTIGNDMSSRDIEGENLLYLPQAKIYERSCALGPWITVGVAEAEARTWKIRLLIDRKGERVPVSESPSPGKVRLNLQEGRLFKWETSVGQIKRTFEELVEFLFRSQVFPHGAVLLTGTGIVPSDDFTLRAGDQVRIEITGIGWLENEVKGV